MNALTLQFVDAKPVPVPGTPYMVCASWFVGSTSRHRVLFEGQFYTVNHHLLACMARGETPAELGLEPDEIEEDE